MKSAIEVVAMSLMAVALLGILYDRIRRQKGISLRAIQFLAVCLVVPALLILALEGKVSMEATAIILGVVIGYTLSGIGKDEPSST